MTPIEQNKAWIRSGKIGCMFATALVSKADEIGWKFTAVGTQLSYSKYQPPKDAFMHSIVFPNHTLTTVRQWALDSGFYVEEVGMYEGLRIKLGTSVSWVQYFGPDSHVKTRQSPYPMLSFAVKLPAQYYWKVGFNGILHLAHASVRDMSRKVQDSLWDRSHIRTEKELGFKPTLKEAAKTTFIK